MLWLDGALYPTPARPSTSATAACCSAMDLRYGSRAERPGLSRRGASPPPPRRTRSAWRRGVRGCDPSGRRGLAPHAGRHALRVTVTRGPGLRGLAPTGPQRPTVMASLARLERDFFWLRLSMDVASAAAMRHRPSRASRRSPISMRSSRCARPPRGGIMRLCSSIAPGMPPAPRPATCSRSTATSWRRRPRRWCARPRSIRGFLLAECGKLGLAAREDRRP